MRNVIEDLKDRKETLWFNDSLESVEPGQKIEDCSFVEIRAAQNRLMRFAKYLNVAFPETAERKGVIESPLIEIPHMKQWMEQWIKKEQRWTGETESLQGTKGLSPFGKLYAKEDHLLPIAGSVKARGGIYEVLKHAEELAHHAGMIQPTDNYEAFATKEFHDFFSQYKLQVGSTGNLGLSIGIVSAKLGFQTIVHMSKDAKKWKKDLLREKGAIVKEYDGDYVKAVALGREESAKEENSYFIDDENSRDLFMGYATAALRLKIQLFRQGVSVDETHPLFVYLPCGVGGAPGGITFGLKEIFGDYVHCFFVEPIETPCMLYGLASGKLEKASVEELGLNGNTVADGLAVAKPSGLASYMMEALLSGAGTVSDEHLLTYAQALKQTEQIRVEPSAVAGVHLAMQTLQGNLEEYIEKKGLSNCMKDASHILWLTGGGLMPEM